MLAICYRPGQGVAHYVEGQTRAGGFLDDQFAVAAACLDAHDATGNIVYEMMAQELALYAMRTLWDRSAAASSIVRRARGPRRSAGLRIRWCRSPPIVTRRPSYIASP